MRGDGYYESIIHVSGGKDSHFLTYQMKKVIGMNPLLGTVSDPFTKTDAGRHNLRNLGESFGCDIIAFNLSVDLFRRVTRIAFEELGELLRFIEAAIYTVPTKLAIDLGIPLVVYGEDASYEYGTTIKETSSAREYRINVFNKINVGFWLSSGIARKEINAIVPPSREALEEKVNPIVMSYFTPWDGTDKFLIAKRFGFKGLTHEWVREGNIESFDQIDSIAYIFHLWMKYPKFGFARTTDIASRWVGTGETTREEAKRLVMEFDHKLDQKALEDFAEFIGCRNLKQVWDSIERF